MPISVDGQRVTLDFKTLLDSINISESFETLNEAIAFISANLNNCKYASDKLSNVIRSFEIDEDEFESSIDEMLGIIDENKSLFAKYSTMKQQYEELQKQYKEISRECEECIKSDTTKVSNLTSKITELEANYNSKLAIISEFEADIMTLVNEISELVHDDSQFTKSYQPIANLRNAVEKLIFINTNLKKEKERVKDMQKTINTQKSQITQLTEKYDLLHASSGVNEKTLYNMKQVYKTFLDHLSKIIIQDPQLRKEHIEVLKKLPKDEIPFQDVSAILDEREKLINEWNSTQLKNISDTQELIKQIIAERDTILAEVNKNPTNLTNALSQFKSNLSDIFIKALNLHEKNLAVELQSTLQITTADALAQNMQQLSDMLSDVLKQYKLSAEQVIEQKKETDRQLKIVESQLNEKNAQLDSLQQQLTNQESELVSLKTKITTLEGLLADSTQTSEEISVKEAFLQTQLTELQNSNSKLQLRLNSLLNEGMIYLQNVISEQTTASKTDVDEVVASMVKIIISNHKKLKDLIVKKFKIKRSTIPTMINEAFSQYQNLKTTIGQNEQKIETLNTNIATMQEEMLRLNESESRAKYFSGLSEQLQRKINVLTQQEKDLNLKYNSLSENYNLQKQNINTLISKTFSDIGIRFQTSNDLYKDVEMLIGKLVSEQKYNSLVALYEEKVNMVAKLEEHMAALNSKIQTLQTEVTSLKDKQKIFDQEAKERYGNLTSEFNKQSSLLATEKNTVAQLKSGTEKYKQHITELETTIATLKETQAAYIQANQTASTELTSTKSELDKYKTSIDAYVQQEQQLRQNIVKLEKEIAEYRRELNEKDAKITSLTNELENVKQLYTAGVREINDHVLEINKYKREVHDEKNRYRELKSKNALLTNEVEQLKSELAVKTDANSKYEKLLKRNKAFPDMRALWYNNTSLGDKLKLLADASIQLTGEYELLPPNIKQFLIMSSETQRAIVQQVDDNNFNSIIETAAKLLQYMSGQKRNSEYFIKAFETAIFNSYVDKFNSTFQRQISSMRASLQKYTNISSFATTRIQNDLEMIINLSKSIPEKFTTRDASPIISIFNNMISVFNGMLTNICGSATTKENCKINLEAEILKISNLLLRLISSTEFFLVPDADSKNLQLFIDSLVTFKQSLNNPTPTLPKVEQAEPNKYFVVYMRETLALIDEIKKVKKIIAARKLDPNFSLLYNKIITMIVNAFLADDNDNQSNLANIYPIATLKPIRNDMQKLFHLARNFSSTDPILIHLRELSTLIDSLGSQFKSHEKMTQEISDDFIHGLLQAIILLIQVDKDVSSIDLDEAMRSNSSAIFISDNRVNDKIKRLPPSKNFNGKVIYKRREPLTFENTIVALNKLILLTLDKRNRDRNAGSEQLPIVNVFDVLLHKWGQSTE